MNKYGLKIILLTCMISIYINYTYVFLDSLNLAVVLNNLLSKQLLLYISLLLLPQF